MTTNQRTELLEASGIMLVIGLVIAIAATPDLLLQILGAFVGVWAVVFMWADSARRRRGFPPTFWVDSPEWKLWFALSISIPGLATEALCLYALDRAIYWIPVMLDSPGWLIIEGTIFFVCFLAIPNIVVMFIRVIRPKKGGTHDH